MMRIVLVLLLTVFTICSSLGFSGESDYDVDARRRASINSFISVYKEAYEKRRIKFIEQFFSDDALIITESRQLKKVGKEAIPNTSKTRPYETLVENRQKYIERLHIYFDTHDRILLGISDSLIVRHKKYPEIYGVYFRQIWDDGSDDLDNLEKRMPGYVFLMVDFRDSEVEPTIHVRTWQPEENITRPSDKYQLSDFRIMSIR